MGLGKGVYQHSLFELPGLAAVVVGGATISTGSAGATLAARQLKGTREDMIGLGFRV